MINSFYTAYHERIDKLSGRDKYYAFFRQALTDYDEVSEQKTDLEEEIDLILSKKIIQHLTDFFKTRRTQELTKKRRKYRLNLSKKRNR